MNRSSSLAGIYEYFIFGRGQPSGNAFSVRLIDGHGELLSGLL